MLAHNGLLRLRVPNAVAILELLKSPRHQSVAEQERLIQSLFGTQAYTGDVRFTAFTKVLLAHYLQIAGFEVVTLTGMADGNLESTARKVREVRPHDVDDFSDLLEIGPDDAFVRACYSSILERQADEEGAGFYVARLADGRMTRDAVIDELLKSDERTAKKR